MFRKMPFILIAIILAVILLDAVIPLTLKRERSGKRIKEDR
jgi:hypothetical protein